MTDMTLNICGEPMNSVWKIVAMLQSGGINVSSWKVLCGDEWRWHWLV